MYCEKCGKLSDVLRHSKDGLFVCDKCNPRLRCKHCDSEIEDKRDLIMTPRGYRCVECY